MDNQDNVSQVDLKIRLSEKLHSNILCALYSFYTKVIWNPYTLLAYTNVSVWWSRKPQACSPKLNPDRFDEDSIQSMTIGLQEKVTPRRLKSPDLAFTNIQKIWIYTKNYISCLNSIIVAEIQAGIQYILS